MCEIFNTINIHFTYYIYVFYSVIQLKNDLSYVTLARVHPAMIVVGTDDPGAMASTRLQIFEYSDDTRFVELPSHK